MIELIAVRNFKSLVSVELALGKFNCLIGMNGLGKSTLLQAIDFLAQQMHGEIDTWLDTRGWQEKDLHSKTGGERAPYQGITLGVIYRLPDQRRMLWEGSFNRASLKCKVERVWLEGDARPQLEVAKDTVKFANGQQFPNAFRYQGSILSQLEDKYLTSEMLQLRQAIRGLRFLELLSPHLLPQALTHPRPGYRCRWREAIWFSGHHQRR